MSPEQVRERQRVKNRRRYVRDAESLRAYARAHRAADPERARAIDMRSKEKNREARRAHGRATGPAKRLREKYGLTPDRIAEIAARQNGLCYLCSEPLDLVTPRKTHVDHDHSCCRGQTSCGSCIRGLACQLCNQGIGAFGDDPERMRRVADSLEMANAALRAGRTAPLALFEVEPEPRL